MPAAHPRCPAGPGPGHKRAPRHFNRHDGWTPERQRKFIEALADTGSVQAAEEEDRLAGRSAWSEEREAEDGKEEAEWELAEEPELPPQPREPGEQRVVPRFLTHGHAELGLPHRRSS